MDVLNKLWRDGLTPGERYVVPGSEYQKAAKRFYTAWERFVETLPAETKSQLESVGNQYHDMASLEQEDIFICGFRLGAKLMLDVLGDYRGQFYAAGEEQP